MLGTAFSFVHLLDYLAEKNLQLPAAGRFARDGNRRLQKPFALDAESGIARAHHRTTRRSAGNIICEYGMSELSSQAYDAVWAGSAVFTSRRDADTAPCLRHFHFPPWARVQIISPETGREVADGETGLIRVFDLANVFSVAGHSDGRSGNPPRRAF